jgi:hypothetical protein
MPSETAPFVRRAVHDRPSQIRLQVIGPFKTAATQCGHDRVVHQVVGRHVR